MLYIRSVRRLTVGCEVRARPGAGLAEDVRAAEGRGLGAGHGALLGHAPGRGHRHLPDVPAGAACDRELVSLWVSRSMFIETGILSTAQNIP